MSVRENSVERLGLSLNPILDLRSAGPLKDILQQGLGRGKRPVSPALFVVGR